MRNFQERLLRTNPDIEDYYHSGEWDLNKEPNASAIERVTIFSSQTYDKSKQSVNVIIIEPLAIIFS